MNEIDAVEKLVRSAENRILELEEEIQTVSKDLAGREELLPLETEQHEERLKDWRVAQRAINEEIAEAEEEIKKLEASMHPRDRAEFQRLLDKKGGLAIVLVAGNSCSACHVKIRPAALQSLKVGPRDHLLRQLQADPLLRHAEVVSSCQLSAISYQPDGNPARELRADS